MSLVASFTAEPTPAAARETAPMIASVAGAEVAGGSVRTRIGAALAPDLVLAGHPQLILNV